MRGGGVNGMVSAVLAFDVGGWVGDESVWGIGGCCGAYEHISLMGVRVYVS